MPTAAEDSRVPFRPKGRAWKTEHWQPQGKLVRIPSTRNKKKLPKTWERNPEGWFCGELIWKLRKSTKSSKMETIGYLRGLSMGGGKHDSGVFSETSEIKRQELSSCQQFNRQEKSATVFPWPKVSLFYFLPKRFIQDPRVLRPSILFFYGVNPFSRSGVGRARMVVFLFLSWALLSASSALFHLVLRAKGIKQDLIITHLWIKTN